MVIFMPLLMAAQATQPADVPAMPPATPPAKVQSCDLPVHRSFDFWIGEWDVYPGTSKKPVANSRIESVANGCVIRESWMPFSGGNGTSMTMFNANRQSWEQVWVGNDGRRVDFSGGIHDGKMILTGNWPNAQAPQTLVRMIYTPNEDGSVRQFGESSTDYGQTWQTSFDFNYRPKKGPTQ